MSAGSNVLSKKLKGGEMVQRLIGSGAEILARGLDKSAEVEADRIGVVLAARAAGAFAEDGSLKDPAHQKAVDAVAAELVSVLSRLRA